MKNLSSKKKIIYNQDYFERGAETGVSLYSNYRWLPELTLPMCHHIIQFLQIKDGKVLDFGCAKGYVVKGLRMLGINAYGVDISNYAIKEAPREIAKYVKVIKTCVKIKGKFAYTIAKDVLEHVPYSQIIKQLKILAKCSKNILIIVPLGDGKKYFIKSMELDRTHIIREDLHWWKKTLEKSGFKIKKATYNLGPFKKNWQFSKKGNGLIVAASKLI